MSNICLHCVRVCVCVCVKATGSTLSLDTLCTQQ